jgi:hypothetical protein
MVVERFRDGDGERISITNDARSTVGQMETCFYFAILCFILIKLDLYRN